MTDGPAIGTMDIQLSSTASQDTVDQDQGQAPRLWHALPAELKIMIFDYAQISPTSKEGLGSWASVSHEWRSVFLPTLWHTLTFQPSNPRAGFRGFTKFVVKGQCRPLIKRVVLHVSLAIYDCGECHKEECKTTIKANNRAFADDVLALFEHLSKWPAPVSPTDGIMFELRVSSPSDTQHVFAPLEGECCGRSKERRYLRYNAVKRLIGYHTNMYGLYSTSENLKSPWETRSFVSPKEIRIIDGFSVNQSTFRALDSDTLRIMLEAMPNLRRVNYEPWLMLQQNRDDAKTAFLAEVALLAARRGVRQVALWEAHSQRLHGDVRLPLPQMTLTSRAVSASLYVTDFALSHTSDAWSFFSELCAQVPTIPAQGSNGLASYNIRPPPPNPFEPLLERLALTAHQMKKLSVYSDDHEDMNDPGPLLVKAALAAARLPRLKIMELWTPGIGKGFFFRYHVKEAEEVRITVASTLHIEKSQKASEAWKTLVAKRHPDLAFHYDTEHINPESLTEPYSICKRLELYHLLREW